MRLIDADALYELLDGGYDLDFDEVPETKRELLRMISAQPTIEERKEGEWEEKTIRDDVVIDEWQSARCPVCKKYHTTPYMYFFQDYNYCPTCGARMRGGEE